MKNSVNVPVTIILMVTVVFLSGCKGKGSSADVKANFDKYVGFWNTGQFDGIENVLCKDYELLESPGFEPRKGIELFKQEISALRTAYPDFHLVIDETVYENDKIALIWTISATNIGPGKMPPTGKLIKGHGISVIHLKDGKIKDEWLASNDLLWMTQLGYTFVPPKTETEK
jgi:predicted ester cyclase